MTRIDLPEERQVGHLTLLRKGRQITLKEYNALPANERLEMIRQVQGKRKYDLLINAVDAESLTPQLHPQELYLTINELGSEYSVELLMMASGEQITTLLDLDCWDGDQVSPLLSLHWLQLLLATGPDKACQLAEQLEPEILALFLKKHLTITRGLEAYDDDDAENAKRLESLYDIDFASEDAAKIIGALLKIWMEHAQESYLLLMEMVRSEISSSLEEEVFQDRNNRLSDLGFVPTVEAKNIYTYSDPQQFKPGGKSDYRIEADELPNPTALLVRANPDNLLAEVLTSSLNHELATELCLLINRKMSADATDISDSEQVISSVQELYDTLNLALEHQAGDNIEKAVQLVDNTYLVHLYQLGHSLLQQAQNRARRLLAGPLGARFDYPEQLFLDTLQEKPPVIYLAASADTPSDLQAITTMKRLQQVNQRLQQIEDLQRLFAAVLPIDHIDSESTKDASLSMLFLTAVANQLLGRPFIPKPLATEDLILLKAQTIHEGRIIPEFSRRVSSQVEQLNLNCQFFIDFCLGCWQEDLHLVDLENLDRGDQLCLMIAP